MPAIKEALGEEERANEAQREKNKGKKQKKQKNRGKKKEEKKKNLICTPAVSLSLLLFSVAHLLRRAQCSCGVAVGRT